MCYLMDDGVKLFLPQSKTKRDHLDPLAGLSEITLSIDAVPQFLPLGR